MRKNRTKRHSCRLREIAFFGHKKGLRSTAVTAFWRAFRECSKANSSHTQPIKNQLITRTKLWRRNRNFEYLRPTYPRTPRLTNMHFWSMWQQATATNGSKQRVSLRGTLLLYMHRNGQVNFLYYWSSTNSLGSFRDQHMNYTILLSSKDSFHRCQNCHIL